MMKRKLLIVFTYGFVFGVVTVLYIINWNFFFKKETTENNIASIMERYVKEHTALRIASVIEQQEKRWSMVKQWADVKLAIYMTTHLSESHLNFFPCWNDAIQRMEIFKYADLILYTTTEPSPEQLAMLPFRNTIIKLYHNLGYQVGAVQAMVDPFLDEYTWFDEYDWVIRVNPDVLIRNDTWLIQAMMNTSYDGIFHDCFNSKDYSNRNSIFNFNAPTVLHTDFYAFRPKAINRTIVLENFDFPYAENHFTAAVKNIWDAKRFSFVDGANNSQYGQCRIEGLNSPVLHVHNLSKSCPYYYNATDGTVYR